MKLALGMSLPSSNKGGSINLNFTFTVNTANSGTSTSNQFTIPTGTGTFLYDVSTSDGYTATGLTGDHTIEFPTGSGIHTVNISGTFPQIFFNNGGDKLKILSVENFGIYGIGSTTQSNAFRGTNNMALNATDTGNFGDATEFEKFMFADNITGTAFPLIDTSSGTKFSLAFRGCRITSFPAGLFDNCPATNFTNAFYNTDLSETSIDNILVSIDTAGQSGGTFFQSGGNAPSAIGIAAKDSLVTKGWTVTYTA